MHGLSPLKVSLELDRPGEGKEEDNMVARTGLACWLWVMLWCLLRSGAPGGTPILSAFLFFFSFLRAVLGSQQNWEAGRESSHILPLSPPPLHPDPDTHSLPHYQQSLTRVAHLRICYDRWTCTNTSQSLKVHSLPLGSLLLLYTLWVWLKV